MKIQAVKVKNDRPGRAWYTDGVNYFYGTDFIWGNSVIFAFKQVDYSRKLKMFKLREMEQFKDMETLPIHELFLELPLEKWPKPTH